MPIYIKRDKEIFLLLIIVFYYQTNALNWRKPFSQFIFEENLVFRNVLLWHCLIFFFFFIILIVILLFI